MRIYKIVQTYISTYVYYMLHIYRSFRILQILNGFLRGTSLRLGWIIPADRLWTMDSSRERVTVIRCPLRSHPCEWNLCLSHTHIYFKNISHQPIVEANLHTYLNPYEAEVKTGKRAGQLDVLRAFDYCIIGAYKSEWNDGIFSAFKKRVGEPVHNHI